MDLDLTPFFKTKAQATDFMTSMAAVASVIYETNFNLEQALLNEFGLAKKDKLIALLHANKINIENTQALKAFFTKIQDTTSKLPVLSLTIAFEPKEKDLQAMSEWFIMNIKKQMLFEVTVNQNLIGGAVINYKGKFMDASIKPHFDKILKDILEHVSDKTQPVQTNQAVH